MTDWNERAQDMQLMVEEMLEDAHGGEGSVLAVAEAALFGRAVEGPTVSEADAVTQTQQDVRVLAGLLGTAGPKVVTVMTGPALYGEAFEVARMADGGVMLLVTPAALRLGRTRRRRLLAEALLEVHFMDAARGPGIGAGVRALLRGSDALREALTRFPEPVSEVEPNRAEDAGDGGDTSA